MPGPVLKATSSCWSSLDILPLSQPLGSVGACWVMTTGVAALQLVVWLWWPRTDWVSAPSTGIWRSLLMPSLHGRALSCSGSHPPVQPLLCWKHRSWVRASPATAGPEHSCNFTSCVLRLCVFWCSNREQGQGGVWVLPYGMICFSDLKSFFLNPCPLHNKVAYFNVAIINFFIFQIYLSIKVLTGDWLTEAMSFLLLLLTLVENPYFN